jgi:predicted thioesterase
VNIHRHLPHAGRHRDGRAVVTKVDGRRIEFDVTARATKSRKSRQQHERMVVDLARSRLLDAKSV